MRHLLLACALILAGCSGSPTANANGGGTVKSTTQANTKVAIVGAMRGFTGENPRFTLADTAKIQIQVQDESGQAVSGLKTVSPAGSGGFSVPDVPSGAYFVVATLPDKTTWSALMRTDHPSDNFLSPGTTLATAWAKQELATKLIFIEDLPYSDWLMMAIRLDAALGDQALKDGDDARLAQEKALAASDANLSDQQKQIDIQLAGRAATNLANPPAYASDTAYKAKKTQLKL